VTTYETATISLGVLQLFVSALGFVVVAWTLRVLLRTLDAQSSAGVATRQLEFDKVILEHPDVYRYFYQGHDYFDGYFQQQGMYRQMWPDIKWKSYIQDHVAKSPVFASLRGRELDMVRSGVCSDVQFASAEHGHLTEAEGRAARRWRLGRRPLAWPRRHAGATEFTQTR
jgi:hypothetical protein